MPLEIAVTSDMFYTVAHYGLVRELPYLLFWQLIQLSKLSNDVC